MSAATYCVGDQLIIFSRTTSLILPRRTRSFNARRSNSESTTISPQGNTKPVLPSSIKSNRAPTRSLTITGQRHNMASLTTNPNGSYSEGNTRISDAAYASGQSGLIHKSKKPNPISNTSRPGFGFEQGSQLFHLLRIPDTHLKSAILANACSRSWGPLPRLQLLRKKVWTAAFSGTFHRARTTARSTRSACAIHHSLLTQKGVSAIRLSGIPRKSHHCSTAARYDDHRVRKPK